MTQWKVPLSAPDISDEDIRAVEAVLRSGRLSLGPQVEAFEKAIASYVGTKFCIAVNSGTSALHLIVRALGIGPGDEVLVPSFTFVASVTPILFERADVRFVDIEKDGFCMDLKDVEKKIGKKTKAIFAVDPFGHPADWKGLEALAKKHNLKLIDDSCEALGAEVNGKKLGTFGDAAAFAFYPNKQITTGEGGVVVTNDEKIAHLCSCWRNQGRLPGDAWLDHQYLGYNYRLDEMSAALGVSQMKRIEAFLSQRARVAEEYSKRLEKFSWVRVPREAQEVRQSWFAYVVVLDPELERVAVIEELKKLGVPVRPYFVPIHHQPFVKTYSIKKDPLPHTEAIAHSTLALPFYPSLATKDIEYVVKSLEQAVSRVRQKRAA